MFYTLIKFGKFWQLLIIVCTVGISNISYAAEPVTPPASTTEPATPVAPATPATEPATPVSPATPATEPATPVAPATPATEPATPVAPATPATEPATPVAPATPATEPAAPEFKPCGSINKQSIDRLQFEQTMTKEKISLIEQLSELKAEKLQECFRTSTERELIGLTILDFSRHTNSDLAKKAKALGNQFDITSYINDSINAENEVPEKIITFLLRMEPAHIKKALDGLSPEKKKVLEEKISNRTPLVLISTDSEQGDRYYIKILWDKDNSEQVDCLTNLFHNELMSERSLEKEKQMMQKLSGKRWIYWYDKLWAIAIADKVVFCGGKTSFVNGLKLN